MKILKQILFTLSFVVLTSVFNDVFAGGAPGPPDSGVGPPCWPPPCVPIDGGIGFLLMAGLAYGGKKVYQLSKTEEG